MVIKLDEKKILQGQPSPGCRQKFLTQMLTLDMFRVANLVVSLISFSTHRAELLTVSSRGGTIGKLGGQHIFAAAPTIPVCPHLLVAHTLFALQLRPCMP